MCAGEGLVVAGGGFLQRNFPVLIAADVTGMGCQLHKHEVEDGIIDDIVAFVGKVAVDVLQKPANLLQRERALEHVDGDDPANLLLIVTLALGC